MNGGGGFDGGAAAAGLVDGNNKISRNYKLLLDPLLVKGAGNKVYRYDGVPDDPAYPPVFPCDPRKPVARVRRLEPMELIVPRWVDNIIYPNNLNSNTS